jgi:hypothetical protein
VLLLAAPASAATPQFGWLARLFGAGLKAAPHAAPMLPKAAPVVPKAAPGLLGAPLIDDAARAVPKGGALGETGALGDDAARASGGAADDAARSGGAPEEGGSTAEDLMGEAVQQGIEAYGQSRSRDAERRDERGIDLRSLDPNDPMFRPYARPKF